MDWQSLFNFVGGTALLAIGWAARTMYESIRELQRDLSLHKQEVARDYAPNSRIARIEDKIDAILARLPPK
jgi:hypothetical protein